MYVGANGGGERDSDFFIASAGRVARSGGTPPETEACPPQHDDWMGSGVIGASENSPGGTAAAAAGPEDGEDRPVDWTLLSLLLMLWVLLWLLLLSLWVLLLVLLSMLLLLSLALLLPSLLLPLAAGGGAPPLSSNAEPGAMGAIRLSAGEDDCSASKGPFSANTDALRVFALARATPALDGALSPPPLPPTCPSRGHTPGAGKQSVVRGATAAGAGAAVATAVADAADANAGGGGAGNACSGRDGGGGGGYRGISVALLPKPL